MKELANNLLIRNVRPMGGPAADVLIRDGRIERIGSAAEPDTEPDTEPNTEPAGSEPRAGVETCDGNGGLRRGCGAGGSGSEPAGAKAGSGW